MHCVKRIKCHGLTDEVTCLHHPASLFPLNSTLMSLTVQRAVMRGSITGRCPPLQQNRFCGEVANCNLKIKESGPFVGNQFIIV